jgi:hypothetical protein
LKSLLALQLTDAQKRIVLSGLGQIQDIESLKLVMPFLEEAAVQNEAAQATISLAAALPSIEVETSSAALKKVLSSSVNDETKQAAQKALEVARAVTDYILKWEVSGPYSRLGKDYSDLFSIAFPPEKGKGNGAKWKPLGPGADPKSPWIIDLLGPLGGEQRVAYARAWIYSEHATPARLEIGSDDGLKVWLNQKVVHANNTYRGLSPGSDRIDVTLNAGWNYLLLKVTQLNGGWAYCARVVTKEGKHLDGLKFVADEKETQQVQAASAAGH